MAGGGPARAGCSTGPVRWGRRAERKFEALGAIQASIVFDAAGTAFVADMAGGVQAFAPSGRRRWQVRLDGGISASPALDRSDQSLFVGTHAGDLVALDTATGAIRWRRGVPTKKDPRILSDLLYLPRANVLVASSWGGRFVVCDATTGEPRCDWDAGISPRSAAAADSNETIYTLRSVAGRGTELMQTTVAGGETVLHREPEDSRGAGRALVSAGPVVDAERGLLYVVFNREKLGHLFAWSLTGGNVAWKQELSAPVEAAPTVARDGVVFVASLSGAVHAFNPGGTRRFECSLACDYLLAAGVSVSPSASASASVEASGASDGPRFLIGDPLGVVHELDGGGVSRVCFEAPRSFQARPSFDPEGRLHLGCTDRWVYRSANR